MRAKREQHTESEGGQGPNHESGGFAKTVDHPSERAAAAIPQGRCDAAENGHPPFAISCQAVAHKTDDQESNRGQQGGNRAYNADPMKAARQTIQLPPPVLGMATTCPLAGSTARGDALLMVASFAMVGWAMVRGVM